METLKVWVPSFGETEADAREVVSSTASRVARDEIRRLHLEYGVTHAVIVVRWSDGEIVTVNARVVVNARRRRHTVCGGGDPPVGG